MDHRIVASQGFVDRGFVPNVTPDQAQIWIVAHRIEDGIPVHEEIQHGDLVTCGQQLGDQHAADIAGAARYHDVPFKVVHICFPYPAAPTSATR